jgi:hypothetical protein
VDILFMTIVVHLLWMKTCIVYSCECNFDSELDCKWCQKFTTVSRLGLEPIHRVIQQISNSYKINSTCWDVKWPNLLNIGVTYENFQKFRSPKQTRIGWYRCLGMCFPCSWLFIFNKFVTNGLTNISFC